MASETSVWNTERRLDSKLNDKWITTGRVRSGKNRHAWKIIQTLIVESDSLAYTIICSENIIRRFLLCPILFDDDATHIFVVTPNNRFYSEIEEEFEHTCYNIEGGLEKIPMSKTFLIYPKSESEFLLFSNNVAKNRPLFQMFNPANQQKHVVKLKDILEGTNSNQEKHDGITKMPDVSLRRKKLNARHKKVLLPKTLEEPDIVAQVCPLHRMNQQLNFPVQASDEQNQPDRTEYFLSSRQPVQESSYEQDSLPSFRATEHRQTRKPPRYRDYEPHQARLESFEDWTNTIQNPIELCKAGFFYTGNADLVRCFQCGIGLKDFLTVVDPAVEHVRYSPECQFLPECLGEDRLIEIKRTLTTTDPSYFRQWNGRGNNANLRRYRHPEYISVDARLATFTTWPSNLTQTPEQLANAGLYYTGFEDQVRCFACDGGLRRWDIGDDPWTEHCRWFPTCPYAIETKGIAFIALVQASVDAEEAGSEVDVQTALEQLTIDPVTQAMLLEHKNNCLSMGYEEQDFDETVKELKNRGSSKPSFDDILDLIDIVKLNREQIQKLPKNETPLDKNRRLKSYVICMQCQKNDINALLLPCGHHKLCMACATPLQNCPVCGRPIRDKIRTYMG